VKACLTVVCVIGLASLAVAADSPIDKGSVFLGGQLSLQSLGGDAYEVDDGNVTHLVLAPQVGGFLLPGFALGLEGSFELISTSGQTATEFHVGPRVAYYYCAAGAQAAGKGSALPYVAGLATIGSVKWDSDDEATRVVELGGEVGVVYLVTDAVGIDTGVKVTSDQYSEGDWDETGLAVTVGVGLKAFLF